MTEVTCSCLHVPGGLDDRSGSVGCRSSSMIFTQLLLLTECERPDVDPNSEIKLIDDAGAEVGVGDRGEIHVRGPNVSLGYWRNEEATRNSFDREGFLKTGDIAMRDEDGRHWIVDRKKELIKVKGFQVAPAELEAALLENEHVADAAVCGLQGEYEELPRAYVVLKDPSKGRVAEKDIISWLAERVARHKRLDGGLKVCTLLRKSQEKPNSTSLSMKSRSHRAAKFNV